MLLASVVFASLASRALAVAIAPHEPLVGRTEAEIDEFVRRFHAPGAKPLPPREKDFSSKLVNTPAHPFIPPHPGALRGPCPAVNTLANHGYIDRSGVDTPQKYVTGAMKAFNLGFELSVFVTFSNFLPNGNHLTNLMSAGHLTPLTGPPPPLPATAAGISTHGTFEGDASLTRLDLHFGSNTDFNEGLFDAFMKTSKSITGNRTIDVAAMAQHRFDRIQQSNKTNPDFFFDLPRFPVAYSEAGFASGMFVDGRKTPGVLDFDTARSFFEFGRMPNGFHSRQGELTIAGLGDLINAFLANHPVTPGANVKNPDGSFKFVANPDPLGGQTDLNCAVFQKFVANTVKLYPNVTGKLRKALAKNVDNYHAAVAGVPCDPIFPFGPVDD